MISSISSLHCTKLPPKLHHEMMIMVVFLVRPVALLTDRRLPPLWFPSFRSDQFHQNYNYFRGKRNATRYFLETADRLSAPELASWEAAMSPLEVWKPSPWLGPNDAVLHLRFFEDRRLGNFDTGKPCPPASSSRKSGAMVGSSSCSDGKGGANERVSFACLNALRHTHLCSWRRDLVDDALFTDGTCDAHLMAPTFDFYKMLFDARARRTAALKEGGGGDSVSGDARRGGGSVGGWDNVWLLSDPVGHHSDLAKVRSTPPLRTSHTLPSPLFPLLRAPLFRISILVPWSAAAASLRPSFARTHCTSRVSPRKRRRRTKALGE